VRDLLKSLAGFLNNIDDLLVRCVPGSEKKLIVDAIGEVALGEEELLGVVIKVVLNEKDIVKDIVGMALATRVVEDTTGANWDLQLLIWFVVLFLRAVKVMSHTLHAVTANDPGHTHVGIVNDPGHSHKYHWEAGGEGPKVFLSWYCTLPTEYNLSTDKTDISIENLPSVVAINPGECLPLGYVLICQNITPI
jgi:hypothetical protein